MLTPLDVLQTKIIIVHSTAFQKSHVHICTLWFLLLKHTKRKTAFQLCSPCDFILHHFTKDSPSHALEWHISEPERGLAGKQGCVLSLRTTLIQDPPQSRPKDPKEHLQREDRAVEKAMLRTWGVLQAEHMGQIWLYYFHNNPHTESSITFIISVNKRVLLREGKQIFILTNLIFLSTSLFSLQITASKKKKKQIKLINLLLDRA